jgi:multimeric flavodoxin WrbA
MVASMKKILGLIGSPRKLGNCEVLVKEICRQVPEEHELKLLRLHDFHLEACRGCYRCLYGGACVIDDGLKPILEAMAEADAYIVAAPAYFLGVNASLKLLLDRGLSFYGIKERLWGKPSIALAVSGIEGKEGYSLLAIEGFLKCTLSDIKARLSLTAALPGEVFFDGEKAVLARKLGEALFGEALVSEAPACPLCGGTSFRFLERGRARCMLCGNEGSYSLASGEAVFDIGRGEHDLFLDREAALRHEVWLKAMKDRFATELPRIRRVREEYRGGDWIDRPVPGHEI